MSTTLSIINAQCMAIVTMLIVPTHQLLGAHTWGCQVCGCILIFFSTLGVFCEPNESLSFAPSLSIHLDHWDAFLVNVSPYENYEVYVLSWNPRLLRIPFIPNRGFSCHLGMWHILSHLSCKNQDFLYCHPWTIVTPFLICQVASMSFPSPSLMNPWTFPQ